MVRALRQPTLKFQNQKAFKAFLVYIGKMDMDEVIKFCEDKKYPFKQIGDNPRLILMGERHGCAEYLSAQEELIQIVKPKILVHEFYRDDSKQVIYEVDNIKPNPVLFEINIIRKWSKKYSFKLKQGDIGPHSQRELLSDLDSIMHRIKEWPLDLDERNLWEEHIYSAYFGRIIAEPIMGYFLQQQLKETTGNVIGIYGAYHLRPDSHIHHLLRKTFAPLYSPEMELPAKQGSIKKQDYFVIFQDKNDIEKIRQFVDF